MQVNQLLKQAAELKQVVSQASRLAEELEDQLSEHEEPAMRAQCSVIRAFLTQTASQEERLSEMLAAKIRN